MACTTALATVTDYVTDARVQLQDTIAPYRYDDASLVTSLNIALLETRRVRPDLFLGRFDDLPQYTRVDDDEVPIESHFRLAILYGMMAHALLRDQEDIQDARSDAFMRVFYAVLIGVAVPGVARRKAE